MHTEAVLFDLDDTLFDHRHAAGSALRAVAARHEALRSRQPEEVERKYHELMEAVWKQVMTGTMSVEQSRLQRFTRLVEWCGAACEEQEALALADRYREQYQGFRQPVPGALELLRALHGRVTVGIVTNNFTLEQQDKLRHCRMDSLIDFLVTSEDAGAAKPDPRIFEVALEHAGRPAERAVMVGDSWESDVLGATRAGIRAVWLNRLDVECPDPSLAIELQSFEPAELAVGVILGMQLQHLYIDARY